jgi:hypothetical protein
MQNQMNQVASPLVKTHILGVGVKVKQIASFDEAMKVADLWGSLIAQGLVTLDEIQNYVAEAIRAGYPAGQAGLVLRQVTNRSRQLAGARMALMH